MTTVESLLSTLYDRQVKLWMEGDRLRYRAPTGAMTSTLRAELVTHKADLIELVRRAQVTIAPPPLRTVSRTGNPPLSFAQQRLCFLYQLEGPNAAYNIPMAWRIMGPLNDMALQQSLSEIVHRHEILRTTFATEGEQWVQVVHPPAPVALPCLALCTLTEVEKQAELERLTRQEAQHLFDLARGPLLRLALIQLAAEEHVLLINMHHIIADGWSLGVLGKELAALYASFANGQPSPLPPLSIQYGDFAHWQREWLRDERLARYLTYWRQKLDGVPPLLALSTDHPRPKLQRYGGARQSLQLSAEILSALKELSRQEGVTLFMTLLAAFQTLLGRYSGQDDIVVGSPIANRNQVEIESLIGFFVNTLVLRADLSGNPTFRELLAQVRKVTLEAYEHQDLPFEQLVEELRPERDPSHTPLFQVMFALQGSQLSSLELPGLTLNPLEIENSTVKFDLALTMREENGHLAGTLAYNSDLFDPATITRMAGHYRMLMEGVTDDPSRRLWDLPLLTPAERHQLLVEWNDTAVDYPKDKCIHTLFEEQVERTPDAIAVVFAEQQMTYRELNARANQLAYQLQELGVGGPLGAETRVGLCVERSPALLVGMLGILKAGGAYIPLTPDLPAPRLVYMLEDARVEVIVTTTLVLSQIPALAEYAAQRAVPLVTLNADTLRKDYPTAALPVRVMADHLAYVIYTSGSTGRPKGVEICHKNVVNLLESMQREPGFGTEDVLLAVTTFAFDIAVLELLLPLVAGGKVVIVPAKAMSNGEILQALIDTHDITMMQATPATWQLLVQSGWQGRRGLKMLCGGEALPRPLADDLLGRGGELWNMYGPTETTIWSASAKVQPDGPISIGRPIANTQFYVLDALGQLQPQGVVGELCIGGAGVARGYFDRAELTAERFVVNSFSGDSGATMYRTGDLVRYDGAGRLLYLGRLDHQVKLRGFRIELGEIEAVLCEHPSVAQSAVALREDRPGAGTLGARLVAYCRPAANANLNFAELARHLQRQLPDYMIPTVFVTLAAFPLTSSGKINRHALPAPEYSRLEIETLYTAPRTPLEEQLTSIWYEVLGLKRVGVYDNFFKLGGHSLLAAQLIARLRRTFQVELPLSRIFETPTIAGLAQWIAAARQSVEGLRLLPPIALAARGQALPLSFAQQRLWFLDQLGAGAAYAHRARKGHRNGDDVVVAITDHLGFERKLLFLARIVKDTRPVDFGTINGLLGSIDDHAAITQAHERQQFRFAEWRRGFDLLPHLGTRQHLGQGR